MSELADNNCLDLEADCENEAAINRLFPRCQPKKNNLKNIEGKRDLNLNKVLESRHSLNDNDHIHSSDKHNDNTSLTRHRIVRNSWQDDIRMDEDQTVHSGYNIAGRGLRTSHTGNGSSDSNDCGYDDGLDAGFRIKTLNNLDGSRIEMAGGREKISQSLLRTAKKKHGDEIIRNNSSAKQNQKRFNGDVLHDDDVKEYKQRSWNQHSRSHKSFRNYMNDAPRNRAPCRISPTSPQEEYGHDSDHGKNDDDDAENAMQVSSSGENTTDSSQQTSPVGKVTRVIGNVPIAEYDGSPRRYGPRPGFPLRVSRLDDSHDIVENDCLPHNQSSDTNETDMQSSSGQRLDEICDQQIAIKNDNVCSKNGINEHPEYSDLEYQLYRLNSDNYIGKRLAQSVSNSESNDSPKKSEKRNADRNYAESNPDSRNEEDSNCESSGPEYGLYNMLANDKNLLLRDRVAQHALLSDILHRDHDRETMSNPDTEDLGETEIGEQVGHSRNFTLSPETTDCDSNDLESELSADMNETCSLEQSSNSRLYNSMPILEDGLSSGDVTDEEADMMMDRESSNGNDSSYHCSENIAVNLMKKQINEIEREIAHKKSDNADYVDIEALLHERDANGNDCRSLSPNAACAVNREFLRTLEQECLSLSPGKPNHESDDNSVGESVSQAIREIKEAIQHSRNVILKTPPIDKTDDEEQEPVWVPRQVNGHKVIQNTSEDSSEHPNDEGVIEEEEVEEETDRLLGVNKTEDNGYYEEKTIRRTTMRNASAVGLVPALSKESPNLRPKYRPLETNDLSGKKKNGANRSKEVIIHEPAVLIEGVLFRARYLGSTQLVCEGQPTKATRMMQAEEAVSRIKAPDGDSQPSADVDLFISTEKIMVLNTDLKEIMMDHALRTISYIADIGELVVLMARRRPTPGEVESNNVIHQTPKMICHVFESDEAQFIAQSIGQAFQVAYMEFLKANGIEDSSFVKEMDYQEVLNSQQIFGDELEMFAKKDKQKEVVVPKAKGEILGMVIVESGWGSMLPTVVIANMAQGGPAARCGQLNIGDQIIAINGVSLVGLPLSTCQSYIKNTRNQTVVKLTMVPCPPVVEVKIKRPDTKYQLGFSVQNGVICSLLRGGIAERGGVRVGHRIIEINTQSVVAVPHERIVNLLATSVGEINMKTMPTSMFRLLTGQDTPIYI